MRLIKTPLWATFALTAFVVSSEGLKSSNRDQPALLPDEDAPSRLKAWPKSPEVTAFIQEAVVSEISEQLQEKLLEHLREAADPQPVDAGAGASVLKKLGEALKPALRAIFASTTQALRPIISEECKHVISVVQGGSSEDDTSEEDIPSDTSEKGASFIAAIQADAGFWDSLKDTVKKNIGKIASPAMTLIADKLAPAFQKLGERAVPLFRDQVQKLIREACEEAEEEAGVVG